MAKLARITQKIFGSGSGSNQIAKFGSLFAGSPAFTTSAAQAMSLSNWLTGWFGAAIGGNSPAIEDMNAVCFVLAYQLAYLCQAGIPEWDAGTTYYIGSLANVGGTIYVSRTDDNLNNLVTDATNWKAIGGDVMNALGDWIYGGVNGAQTKLAGNTTTTLQILTQVGNGLGTSAAPVLRDFKAPNIVKFTSSGTYTPSAGVMYSRIRAVAGGGGGGGGGASAANGGAGGNTTFASTLIVCVGGTSSGQGGIGASGGAATIDPSLSGTAQRGAPGGATNQNNSGAGGGCGGGTGGTSPFGGGGGGGWAVSAGNDAAVNSGSGGGGGGSGASSANGQGGSSGGYADAILVGPTGTYAVVIGAAGAAGGAGGGGGDGGLGGSGYMEITEYFQ